MTTLPTAHAPVVERLPRAALALAVVTGLLVLFAVLVEGGAASALGGSAAAQTLHEVFHDARHLLGVPCH
jgi:hypothetical protein